MKIVIFYDEPGWAWWHRAHNIKKNISSEFSIDILKIGTPIDHVKYDLVLLFEAYLYDHIAAVPPEKVITGSSTLQTLPSAVARYNQINFAGFVVNNLEAYQKISHLPNTFCCQNGVDESLFYFKHPRCQDFTACWVGNNISQNNKGLDLIRQSCDIAVAKLIALDQSVNVYKGKVLTQKQLRDQLYYQASCYICASEMEGTPNPALEALSCGLPVISTRVGNMPEIIVDGYNGFLVDRSVEAIVRALEKLKRTDVQQMSLNARNSILNGWTWKKQVLKYEHMFRTLCNSCTRSVTAETLYANNAAGYIAGAVPQKSYELITVSFFHKRMHLARRMLDTLAFSAYPQSTLHIFLLDRSPEMEEVIASFSRVTDRDVYICRQTSILEDNPYCLHINWVMEKLRNVDFRNIAIIDSDFELHSKWYAETMKLKAKLSKENDVTLFTAFNNCNSSGWRHATIEMHKDEDVVYGIKPDCGSGQVLMDRNIFFSLGNMGKELQDFTWVFRCREEGYMTATTLPSYCQHLGAASSKIGHSDLPDEYYDTALDFFGDYEIDSRLCGIWSFSPNNEKIYIHRNGLITTTRGVTLANIFGHVSMLAEEMFELTTNDCCFRFKLEDAVEQMLCHDVMAQKIYLRRHDASGCVIVRVKSKFNEFNVFKYADRYYVLDGKVEIIRADVSLFERCIADKTCWVFDDEASMDSFIKDYKIWPITIEENYQGYKIIKHKYNHFALYQGVELSDVIAGDDNKISGLRNAGAVFINEDLDKIKADIQQYLANNGVDDNSDVGLGYYLGRARYFYKSQQPVGAMGYLKSAIEHSPHDAEPWIWLSRIAKDMGEKDFFHTSLRAAKERNLKHPLWAELFPEGM